MLEQLTRRLALHRPWRIRAPGAEAGVLVALTDSNDPEVVLTLRAKNLSTHRGEVAFPGGKRDPEDLDVLATALREAEEEVGLHSGQVRIIGSLGQLISKHRLAVTPWVGIIRPDVHLVANPGEIERIFRVPLRFFLEQPALRTDEIPFRGKTHYVPAWEYEGAVIWGLTAYVLVELLNTGFDAGLPMRPRPEHLEIEHE
ncbi:CoA pyrophosphatase [Marinobacterium lutimaris]|uniref:NUDIX domain-containing protein n=1 Tax=Marinobacterium lutimaris TaxID=568106 RepID=A0A1H6D5U0_9GAMM|nr:CoA pyrophosphatase [Marinobacterium lutimaris]SEG80757.1 NUDIX domain-containing protein [Marinobacterium lutimaris]